MRARWLGSDIPYPAGMAAMHDAMARVDDDGPVLLLLEHQDTLTITRRGGTGAFIAPRDIIEHSGIAVYETDRGGDVTYHGVGQLVGYPVLRLGDASLGSNVVGYVHALEAALIAACRELGVADAHAKDRDEGGAHLTGVWCDAPIVDAETLGCNFHQILRGDAKICALGVGIHGGVTRHGFALNVTTNLERFTQHVIPCGLSGRAVTSLERVLPRVPAFDHVRSVVERHVVAALSPWHRARAARS